MAVLREWRAEIRRALKEEYVQYVNATGLAAYLRTPGNLGASVAVRDLDSERTEIVTLSWWTDTEAIKAFAGRNTGARAISPTTTASCSRAPSMFSITRRRCPAPRRGLVERS